MWTALILLAAQLFLQMVQYYFCKEVFLSWLILWNGSPDIILKIAQTLHFDHLSAVTCILSVM